MLNGYYYPTFELRFFEDLKDIENVSEMVAETSEASKVLPVKTTRARAQIAKSAANENNTRAEFTIWSVQKKRLFSVKNVLLCYKAMDNV